MNISPRNRFWLCASLMIFYYVLMGQAIAPLNSKQIVDFELAGNISQTQQMIAAWKDAGIIDNVYLSIYLDFIFPILYTLTLYFAISWTIPVGRLNFQRVRNNFLSWIWLAPAADYLENSGLLLSLSKPTYFSVMLSYYFAMIKFAIIFLALAFCIINGFRVLITKQSEV